MRHFPTKILLATDGSEDAALALRAALDLAALGQVSAISPVPEHAPPPGAL